MNERLLALLADFFWKILLPGLTVTLPLTAISFFFAMVIALAQFANLRMLRQFARFYIWVIRGTPLLVQLFVVFYGLSGVGIVLPPFLAAVIVFSVNEGAYGAEIIRAALESVPKGQMEAGYCVGMSYLQIIRRIVLPQAMRTAFPSLSHSLIAMVKDTGRRMQGPCPEAFPEFSERARPEESFQERARPEESFPGRARPAELFPAAILRYFTYWETICSPSGVFSIKPRARTPLFNISIPFSLWLVTNTICPFSSAW